MKNEMILEFSSASKNESFARSVVAAFVTQLDPTLEELSDLKTAVSEAVTNAIIHGYEDRDGSVKIRTVLDGNEALIEIEDYGAGIADIHKAMEPFYTSKPELERSGMGFSFMEAFMDDLHIESALGKGTKIIMRKVIGSNRGSNA